MASFSDKAKMCACMSPIRWKDRLEVGWDESEGEGLGNVPILARMDFV